MLKTRVITALVLLSVLLPVLFWGSYPVFAVILAIFFAAAAWECFRLFNNKQPAIGAAIWTAVFAFILFHDDFSRANLLFFLSVAIWIIRLLPSLRIGLPAIDSFASRLLNGIYGIAILGCFIAMAVLFKHSAIYLLSVMAIVWIADIGAYFFGKAFGKHKLAPTISPGKSWEGAFGGAFSVLLIGALTTFIPALSDTFAAKSLSRWGWSGFVLVLMVLVAASVVGDLFESQLKRKAGIKDSSGLLPGHGGVLDRIDALIPVMPLAALLDSWF